MRHSSILYLLSEDIISRIAHPEERGDCEIWGRSWNDRKQVEVAYREPQRGHIKQDRTFIPCKWKAEGNETEP